MGKLEHITAALHALPETTREEIAEILETMFHGDLYPECALSEEQLADLKQRAASPGPIVSQEEADAFFARFRQE